MELPVVDHGTSRAGRWLRERRLRLALWLAVAEGILVVVGVVPGWIALLVGAALVLAYLLAGRNAAWDAVRQASWIAAASQVLVALVPLLVFVVGFLAILALAVLVAIALVVLFLDRR